MNEDTGGDVVNLEDFPEIMTPEDLIKYLGKSSSTIYPALRRGEIPARNIGGRWYIGRYSLGVYLGVYSPNEQVAKELSALRAEIAELKNKIRA